MFIPGKTIWKNLLTAAVSFALAILPGCSLQERKEKWERNPHEVCFRWAEIAPKTEEQIQEYARALDPDLFPYDVAVASWVGRHLNELLKAWDSPSDVAICPREVYPGSPFAAVVTWYQTGLPPPRTEYRILNLLLLFFDSVHTSCQTEFALDEKGRIIYYQLATGADGSIKDCEYLIRTEQWHAPTGFDE